MVLSSLKGDGEAPCTLGDTAAVVRLYNSGESSGENLVTHLYQNEVTDISGSVPQDKESVASVGTGSITGVQTEDEDDALEVQIEGAGDGDVSTITPATAPPRR